MFKSHKETLREKLSPLEFIDQIGKEFLFPHIGRESAPLRQKVDMEDVLSSFSTSQKFLVTKSHRGIYYM